MKQLRIFILIICFILVKPNTIAPIEISDYNKRAEVVRFLNMIELRRYNTELDQFINQLGFAESTNNWKAVNSIGAIGEWQFMENTLQSLGYNITSERFKNNPSIFPREVQEKALKALIKSNMIIMDKYCKEYEGKIIMGVKITRAGIIASCHLAGAGGVQNFLKYKLNATDINGTSVYKYMKDYQNYDLICKIIT